MRRSLVVAAALAATPAAAHVAPSVDDNNRYLKLTPQGDRVRIAYTVFFGEVPGAQTRPSIDRDRDGAISEAEAQAFGTRLAGEVGAAIELEIDGAPQRIAWSVISVGMGSPKVAAGSFSVDMIAYPCLPSLRGRHRVHLRDRFRLLRPGETEVKIEDSPGVAIEAARIGSLADPTHDFRFAGPGGPLSDDGLELVFVAGDHAPVSSDATCRATAGSGGGPSKLAIGGAAAALAAAAGGAVVVARRRRRGDHSARK